MSPIQKQYCLTLKQKNKMKKLFVFAAVAAMVSMVSCSKKADNAAADSTAVDSVVVADSVAADSVVADSAAAVVDSAAVAE